MRQILLMLTFFFALLISSCRKDTANSNADVIGNWIWKSSSSSNGVQMFSTDTTKIFSLQFKYDNTFVNQAYCIIGGPTEGNYQIQHLNDDRILILKTNNIRPDTLKISVADNKLTLTETNNGYSWYHYFKND
ncbi:MAG: hypothetical protein QM802_05320 [Agriterribacter sp.]